jgi:flagellin-specific chaperone FliS
MSKEDLIKIKIDILGKELSLKQAKEIYQQLDELFRFMPKTLNLNKYKEQNKKYNSNNSNRPISEVFFKENQTTINNIDIFKMSYN